MIETFGPFVKCVRCEAPLVRSPEVMADMPRLVYKHEDRDEVQEATIDLCPACLAVVAKMDDAARAEFLTTWLASTGEDITDWDLGVVTVETAELKAKLARLGRWADWLLTLEDQCAQIDAAYRKSVAAGHGIPGVLVGVEGDIDHDEDLGVRSDPFDLTPIIEHEKGRSFWQGHGVTPALERLPQDHFLIGIVNDDVFVVRSRPQPVS
jgi:hypothetical protein